MLVTFKSEAYADIVMFGEVAIRLLKLMGHSGTVPGAILAEDIPAALNRLKQGLAAEGANMTPRPAADAKSDEADEPPVSLKHRALPLIEMLTAAVASQCNVMWDK